MKKTVALILCILVVGISFRALAYPYVGQHSLYSLPGTFNSGSFQNYHFPNRYFQGSASGYQLYLRSASKANVSLNLETFRRQVALGNGSTWQTQHYVANAFNSSNIGYAYAVDFSANDSYYYGYRFTKDNSQYPGDFSMTYRVEVSP